MTLTPSPSKNFLEVALVAVAVTAYIDQAMMQNIKVTSEETQIFGSLLTVLLGNQQINKVKTCMPLQCSNIVLLIPSDRFVKIQTF